jgi:hypothetical protein
VVICGGSVALGGAICAPRGGWSWAAPAVGMATAMLLALIALRLPGHAATAAAALAGGVLVSLLRLRRRRPSGRAFLGAVAVAAVALAATLLPFVANDRLGELGASQLNDFAFHLGQADAMREQGPAASITSPGYPIGPHAVVAALAKGTGLDTADAFLGLLLALPALTALTALGALEGVRWRLRAPAAALAGLAYLPVSYLAQGAFKEPLLALCFLGFVVSLRAAWNGRALDRPLAAALALTAAGGVAAFGAGALAWPAAALLWLALLGVMADRRRLRLPRLSGRAWWALAAAAGAAVLATLLLLAATSDLLESGPLRFFRDRGVGGNFDGQLSPAEALGIWPRADFRRSAAGEVLYVPGIALAVAVTAYGAAWCWRRREAALLAGALAGATVYAAVRPFTLAYFSGKALAVLAPLAALVAARGLLGALEDAPRASPRRLAAALAAACWALLCAHSSALALRGAYVRPQDRGPDLAAFRAAVRDEPTLYLGRDDYAGWELRGDGNVLGFQGGNSPLARHANDLPSKAGVFQPAVDFDSLPWETLALFRYVITPRTAYASRPPAEFRPVARSRWHVLWKRDRPLRPRRVLFEGEAPGRVLRCTRGVPREAGLRGRTGVAFVRPAPVVGEADAWRVAGDPSDGGATLTQRLELPRGRWDISIRYFSDLPLALRAGPLERLLPPYVADRSSFFSAGRVKAAGGPVTVRVYVPERRRLDVRRFVRVEQVAATRVDRRGRLVPLHAACGRYVDWYRLRG